MKRMTPGIHPFEEEGNRLRNWGRWGDDDEIGTLNFLTPERIAQAATLVRRGIAVSLALDIQLDGVWDGHIRRRALHLMHVDGGDDAVSEELVKEWVDPSIEGEFFAGYWASRRTRFADDVITMHLQGSTQWDSLAHSWYDNTLYNGAPSKSITSLGTTKNGIHHVAEKGVVGRGVLLDVARFRGVAFCEPQSLITTDELDQVAQAQGVEVRPGDILLIRTGWASQIGKVSPADWRAKGAGLGWQAASWLHEKNIAAIAADNMAVERVDPESSEVGWPLHLICQRDMGLMFGEIWNLESLSQECAAGSQFEFLLVAPPLKVRGGVGSPVNPIAIL